MNMNYSVLVRRAEIGTITQEDILKVVNELDDMITVKDPSILLLILGEASLVRSNASNQSFQPQLIPIQYFHLVERYLNYHEDPYAVQQALMVITQYWGFCDRIIDQMLGFMLGSDWDEDMVVRIAAISLAGECFRECRDLRLLRRLMEIYNSADDNSELKLESYAAIARSVGVGRIEVKPTGERFDPTRNLDLEVIRKARQLIGEDRPSSI